MKRIIGTLFLLFFVEGAVAQTNECGTQIGCACRTNKSANVILSNTLSTNLQTGDVITARYGNLCVGQATYTQGQAINITVWGENTTTGDIGIPEGATIEYSVFRPATNLNSDQVAVTYSSGDGIYSTGDIEVADAFSSQTSLPVELTGLEAVLDGQAALLKWTTASELNNAGFSIEHARGDSTFEPVAFVDGHGSTTTPHQYRFRTDDLEPGHHTFRLKQIDLDGSFSYSDQVELDVELPDAYTLSSAYPNPFNPETRLNLTLREAQQVTVEVYDVLGRRVRTLFRGAMEANRQQALRFEAGDLASGLYLIQVRGESFHDVREVTLLK